MRGRTLIAYITAGGATEDYAHAVAETLRLHGHEVDVVNLKQEEVPDMSPYVSAVVGMGVRMGMVYRKGKQFLRRKDLKGKALAIFLSSGMAIDDAEKSKEKFLTPVVKRYGLSPVMYVAFPGKMPGGPGRLEDRTDLDLARRWAEELTGRLSEPV